MTTMLSLVDLDITKQHLRVDSDAEDLYIQQLIESASSMVVAYLKQEEIAGFVDSSGNLISSSSDAADIPDEVIWAVLYLVGVLYKDRDGEMMMNWNPGFLPQPVISALYPLRQPTIA